jgi:hypothetical protein
MTVWRVCAFTAKGAKDAKERKLVMGQFEKLLHYQYRVQRPVRRNAGL